MRDVTAVREHAPGGVLSGMERYARVAPELLVRAELLILSARRVVRNNMAMSIVLAFVETVALSTLAGAPTRTLHNFSFRKKHFKAVEDDPPSEKRYLGSGG